MNITKFSEKLNKLDNNVYTIEEVVNPVAGVYEADLGHDNVEPNTINVYTGSKCTGNKINTFVISTPSLTPWKIHIIIYSSEPTLYITYETIGDTIEADDINCVQGAINDSQKALNDEITRSTNATNTLTMNLNNEIARAKSEEGKITTNLNNEVTRAKSAEGTLTNNLNNEVTRATNKENALQTNITNEISRAKSEEGKINTALNNIYTKAETFSKSEVTKKIQDIVGAAPAALDTLQEIAKSLNNDSDFAGTITNELSKKANKSHTHTKSQITDMPTKLSQFTNDAGFIKASDVDTSQNHVHSNKTVLDKITQTSLDNWDSKLQTKKITTVTDLDTLKDTCVYYIKAASCPNNPTSNWGTLFISNEGTLFQIFVPDSSNSVYKRSWNGSSSSWGSWINLISKSAIGLGNVDNTSDANKPISNATKKELDKKVTKGMTWAELEGK